MEVEDMDMEVVEVMVVVHQVVDHLVVDIMVKKQNRLWMDYLLIIPKYPAELQTEKQARRPQ